jgi:transcriptional regulator with XRE-family HTH domain
LKSIYSQEYQALLSKLVAARKAGGLTQQSLADKLGRHQSFISKIETGERRMDVVEFLHISRAIGFDPCSVIMQIIEKT